MNYHFLVSIKMTFQIQVSNLAIFVLAKEENIFALTTQKISLQNSDSNSLPVPLLIFI